MKVHRTAAWVMLCVQCIAMFIYSGTLLFPSIALVAGTIAATHVVQSAWLHRHRSMVSALIAIGFVVAGSYFPNQQVMTRAFVPAGLLYAFAQLAITLQVFLMTAPAKRINLAYPLCAAAGMLLIGNVRVNAGVSYYQALAVIFVLATAVFMRTSTRVRAAAPSVRPYRYAIYSVVAVAAMVLSGVASTALYTYRNELDQAFAEIVAGAADLQNVGFSRIARLDSIKNMRENGEAVALRIYSNRQPGYMRGMVYDVFDGQSWATYAWGGTRQSGESHMTMELTNEEWYSFEFVPGGGHSHQAAVWTSVPTYGVFLLPYQATCAHAPVRSIYLNSHQALETIESQNAAMYGYCFELKHQMLPLDEALHETLLSLPVFVHPAVREIAREVFADAETTEEKVAAVISYFRQNFEYELGAEFEDGRDHLYYFLLERTPAHCEYFASGAALLLRLGGVPCRYVNGYVAAERHPYGGYWLARQKDAHAWVEAWDPEEGWILVEATPPGGVPHGRPTGRFAAAWDYFAQRVREVQLAIASGNWRDALARGVMMVATLLTGPALIALAFLMMLAFTFRYLRTRDWKNGESLYSPDPAFAALLAKADRRLARAGLQRARNETPIQFAQRIDSTRELEPLRPYAAWYEGYAALRFQPVPQEQKVQDLSARLEALETPPRITTRDRNDGRDD